MIRLEKHFSANDKFDSEKNSLIAAKKPSPKKKKKKPQRIFTTRIDC